MMIREWIYVFHFRLFPTQKIYFPLPRGGGGVWKILIKINNTIFPRDIIGLNALILNMTMRGNSPLEWKIFF